MQAPHSASSNLTLWMLPAATLVSQKQDLPFFRCNRWVSEASIHIGIIPKSQERLPGTEEKD